MLCMISALLHGLHGREHCACMMLASSSPLRWRAAVSLLAWLLTLQHPPDTRAPDPYTGLVPGAM